jgi:GPH family glycoside/pentoside/hexuronide:cation symporter
MAQVVLEDAAAAADADAPLARLSLGVRAGYGLGALASGIAGTVLAGSVLQLYFNQVIGLPAAWVGAAIMVTIIIDSITDPLIGRFSDGLRTPLGRRHVLMYASAVPSALGVLAMWHAPQTLGAAGLLAFMVGMLLFVRIVTSFFDIPSRALGPELAPDYHDRTGLIAWRFLFAIAGGAVINAILYQVFLREDAANPLGVLNRERYADFGLFAAALILITIIASTFATHHRIKTLHVPPAHRQTLRDALVELRGAVKQPGLLLLMLATMLNGFGGGLWFGLYVYLFLNFWGLKPQEMSWVILASPVSSVLALWLVPRLSALTGKRPFMMACYLGWLVMFLTPFVARMAGLMPAGGTALWGALAAIAVVELLFAYGVHIVLQSMLTDAADAVAVKTGRRLEGVLFATFGLLDKWGIAFGAFGAGLVLALVGFPTKAVPGTVAPEIVNGLALACVPAVAACNMVAMVLISRFRIDHAQHAANIAELRRRELENAGLIASADV